MLERVIETRCRDLGGFQVGRVLPSHACRMVGPFVFFDRMGPHALPAPVPRQADVRPHPHIGLSTVTYLFEGRMTHRDSTGATQEIVPGALNWMTAGAGMSHSERFDGMRERGGRMDGIQAWVAVPQANEEDAPSFDHYDAAALPVADEGGVRLRLIAGTAFGLRSPARTHSPLFYVHAELEPRSRLALPREHAQRAAYVADGSIEVDGSRHRPGQMLVFSPGSDAVVEAPEGARLMLLGGEALGERHVWWNFVSSRRERIEQARADWLARRIALPPTDRDEFIPLPDEPAPAPNPMS